jgi:hypothetical protein
LSNLDFLSISMGLLYLPWSIDTYKNNPICVGLPEAAKASKAGSCMPQKR